MKIIHCCLAAFYIDDAGYQENILPRMHKLQGHDVTILASTESYVNNRDIGYLQPGCYWNRDGIQVTRIPYRKHIPIRLVRKLRFYEGVYDQLNKAKPDIIFLHDCQFLDIHEVVRYVQHHREVQVFVDGHTDLVNSARNWISRRILHGIVYKHCAKAIEPYATRFFGVLPARVEFFEKIYGISPTKTELLVLGADDTLIDWEQKDGIRCKIRSAIGVTNDEFMIVTGGKLDRRKNIHHLIRAVSRLASENARLVVFGTPSQDMEAEFSSLIPHERVRFLGWLDSRLVYDYFLAADFGVFPGTHSALWEQAVGTGLPCAFMKWPGMQHVDVGGNCCFLETGSEDEIVTCLDRVIQDHAWLAEMRRVALTYGVSEFAYSKIAQRSIGFQ